MRKRVRDPRFGRWLGSVVRYFVNHRPPFLGPLVSHRWRALIHSRWPLRIPSGSDPPTNGHEGCFTERWWCSAFGRHRLVLVQSYEVPFTILRVGLTRMRILLGTDGSRYSLAAARFLAEWIPGKGKHVDLVAVAPKSPPSIHRSFRKPQPADDLWKGELGRWIGDTARPLESTGYDVQRVPAAGASAASYIVDRIRREDYDLVAVGGKGRSDAPFFDMGSVARSVLEFAPTSVLMVREREPKDREKRSPDHLHPFRILLPTDGEEHSLEAIRELLALLEIPDVSVRVVTTFASGERDALAILPPSAREDFRREADKRARLRLNRAKNLFEPHEFLLETGFLEGAVEEAVVEEARAWEADLLVLGSSGSVDEEGSRRQRSVALAVARRAPTSVLLVRRR